jgi:CheY-like chemotaxis protein
MPRIRLIHWNAEEARSRATLLRRAGHSVVHKSIDAAGFNELRRKPPAAIVIDLSRIPSQGRDLALAVGETGAGRRVPIVFVEGEPEKVERIKTLVPDAVYTTWRGIRGAVKRAIAKSAADPVQRSRMAAYSATPLPKKLGIKEGSVVALVGAPSDFEKTLEPLPAEARLVRRASGKPDLAIWFAKSRSELERRIGRLGALPGAGGLWIAWPKKSSGVATDLDQNLVRRTGLASGLVDYKICAVDETWSGLRFARRKKAK